jgi:hypothetical protein
MRGYSLAGGNAGALNSTLGPMLDTQGQCFCVYAYPQHPCNARGKKERKTSNLFAHSSYNLWISHSIPSGRRDVGIVRYFYPSVMFTVARFSRTLCVPTKNGIVRFRRKNGERKLR